MGYLRLLYRIPWLLLHILVGTPVVVLCHYRPLKDIRVGGRSLQDVVAIGWSRSVCRIFGLRLDAVGNVPPGPQLIVANHISWIDITVMHSVASMGFVSKAEIRKWPVIGFIASVGGTVFHQRGCRDSASGVAHQMGERLREGGNVAIFPEGGILPGDGIGPEVTQVALDVIAAAGVELDTTEYDLGGARYLNDGTVLPDETLDRRCAEFDIHPTGPLPGRGDSGVAREAATLEQAVLENEMQLVESLARAGLDADRRSLRLKPGRLECELDDDDDGGDGGRVEAVSIGVSGGLSTGAGGGEYLTQSALCSRQSPRWHFLQQYHTALHRPHRNPALLPQTKQT